VLGLPTEPNQAEQVVEHIGNTFGLPISKNSISRVGKQIKALNNKSTNGTTAKPLIGSTPTSHALIIDLESTMVFSASPTIQNPLHSVMEMVVTTTSSKDVEYTSTVVIVPWIIEHSGEMNIFLRFHHMVMDAKSELIHAIYQQLAQITQVEGELPFHTQLQFIVRLINVDQLIWVVDIIGPFEISNLEINQHFTGNPAGEASTIILDGIPTQVIGGYGISGASHHGFMHPALIWANLPRISNVPLRYLVYILELMGCEKEGIVSVLQAKAATVRPGAKSRSDRFSMQHKAHSPSAPTIIFSAVSHLKYFLDHAARFLIDEFPTLMIGHSGNELPKGGTEERYTTRPLSVKAFMEAKTFKRYLSNEVSDRFKELVLLSDTAAAPVRDYFKVIDTLLRTAQQVMQPDDFAVGIQLLYRRYGTDKGKEVEDAANALQATHIARYQSPSKRQKTDSNTQGSLSGQDTTKTMHSEDLDRHARLRRQRTYLQNNLEYMYNSDLRDKTGNPMDEGDTGNLDETAPPAHTGAHEENKAA
jgi:hypothetical protein